MGSASLGIWHPETVRRIARNQLRIVARHYSPGMLSRNAWHILVAHSLWAVLALRHRAGSACLRGIYLGLRDFRRSRPAAFDPELPARLMENEALIRQLQSLHRTETYWHLYFLLTRGGTN
jgi:hypothetical protein